MASFTGVGDSVELFVPAVDEVIDVSISGTYNMTIDLEREIGSKGSGSWITLESFSTPNATVSRTLITPGKDTNYRLIVRADTSGTATATLSSSSDPIQHRVFDVHGREVLANWRQNGLEVLGYLTVSGAVTLGTLVATDIGATAAEINNVADVSARVQTLTVSGAVTAGKQSVQLNHATVVVAATIAAATGHPGLFIVKNTSASGTAAHTLTLTAGTFDGTNNIATLDAPGEALVVYFDSAGNGVIVENIGAVGLST